MAFLIGMILSAPALAVLLFITTDRRARRLARCAEAAYPPQGAFATVEGRRLHYVRRGDGDPIVLLHGSDGFQQDFAPVLEASAEGTGDLIAFDRPGHGFSDAPDRDGGALAMQARLLHTALQQLGIRRPILVGHSWSGALALYYALEHPGETAGLTLLNPWIYPAVDPPSRLIRLGRLLGPSLVCAFLTLTPLKRRLLHAGLTQAFAPDPTPPDYEREAVSCWLRSRRHVDVFLQENVDAWSRFQTLAPRYREIHVPVVIVIGDQDRVVHAEHHGLRLHRELTASVQIIAPRTGHELPQTRPQTVLDAITLCRQMAADVSIGGGPGCVEVSPAPPQSNSMQRARDLVRRYGWNPTAYQILNPDITHWFSPDGEAVVGYVRRRRTRVAAGAPICDDRRLAEVATQFEQDAAKAGERVCWFAAATRLRKLLEDRPVHAALAIGAQPIWNPSRWSEIIAKNRSLRAQLNRARNKGVSVSEWPTELGAQNTDLQRCLEEWLARHPLPTLHFLTEPVTLDRLMDRRLFVAEREGAPVGFLIATPTPARNGWLVEQIVRGDPAPNGTPEMLVDAAMRALAADGYDYVTLGLVPLTRRTPAPPPRLWLRLLLNWARKHGRRFYNFEGLDAFKAKFKPDDWEPLFAISNEPHISFRTLLAIAAAFSDGPLIWTAARALTSAARQEAVWMGRRLRTAVSLQKQ